MTYDHMSAETEVLLLVPVRGGAVSEECVLYLRRETKESYGEDYRGRYQLSRHTVHFLTAWQRATLMNPNMVS